MTAVITSRRISCSQMGVAVVAIVGADGKPGVIDFGADEPNVEVFSLGGARRQRSARRAGVDLVFTVLVQT